MPGVINQQETAKESFKIIVADGTAKKQSGLYLYTLKRLGKATDREIDAVLKLGIRQVSRSRNELGTQIIVVDTKKDESTNRTVNVYAVNPNPDLFQTKKNSTQKKMKMLRDYLNNSFEYVSKTHILQILNS